MVAYDNNAIQRVKYPRTPHLPHSPSVFNDDKVIDDNDYKELIGNKWIVATEKMDGEATTIYADGYVHARSTDYKAHPSRDHLKALAAQIAPQIDSEMRICGENLFAKHSIEYDNLSSYFMVYSIWLGDSCLSWWDTVDIAHNELGLITVPVLYEGAFDKQTIQQSWEALNYESEGYVVRNADSFVINDFSANIAKYVRENHVQTKDHWMYNELTKNKLKG